MPDRADLLEEAHRLEKRLADLAREEDHVRTCLAGIREQLAAWDHTPPPASSARLALSSDAKVALFRSLFRGRADVFARRWEGKNGRSGYSPACANEWVRGVCRKPAVKCGECSERVLLPVTDAVIQDHLLGKHVVGAYPLLPDETCWFLAADFDGPSWQDDVGAFRETCRSHDLPVVIERSRSGNGGHAWFFFETAIPAVAARRLGSFLLTETQDRRPGLSFTSYDRLFPNQDTMPKGGFGNLIALPLQKEARARDCTVFLDDAMRPWDDPWAFLASVRRVDPVTVDALVQDATRSGRVLGVRAAPDFENDATPWDRPPSGRPTDRQIDLPRQVKGTLRQQFFVEIRDLVPVARMRLKRIAAFENPVFFRHERMRLSTARIPRVIACAEELPEHLALPRGCVDEVRTFLDSNGSRLDLEDLREPGQPTEFVFRGELRPAQDQAVRRILAHDMGVLVAPPGTGKTVAGVFLVAARRCSTLILVHRQPLLDQWVRRLAEFLGVPAKSIGQIGAGKRKPNGLLDVAMIQSLVRGSEVDDLVAEYGQVIVDECHHVSAVSFERVLKAVRARFVVGLTATPARRDGHHPILHMQCGPIRHTIGPSESAPGFSRRLVCRETSFRWNGPADAGIQAIYGAIEQDDARNTVILDDVISAVAQGRSPIVLTERRSHLDFLAARLERFVKHLVVLHGGAGRKEQRAVLERLASIPDSEERLLLATGRYIGEGFDDARLDTLFLVMPVSWRGTLVQYAGRLDRPHSDKRELRIIDYVDREEPVLAKMFEKRLRGYRRMGYLIEPAIRTVRLPGI